MFGEGALEEAVEANGTTRRCFQNQLAERGVGFVVKFNQAERYVRLRFFVCASRRPRRRLGDVGEDCAFVCL